MAEYNPIEIARQYAPRFDKPVVDMVEVVRCKDCFHYHDGYVLPKHCALTGWATEPNDYCSSAEKRSDFYSIENDGTYSAGGGDDSVYGGGNGRV